MFSALRSPLSALRSLVSGLRSPVSGLRSPLSLACRSALIAVVGVVQYGCGIEYDLKEIGDEEEYSQWKLECPSMYYQSLLYVDSGILQDCLGVDSNGSFVSQWPGYFELEFADEADCLTGPDTWCTLIGSLYEPTLTNNICEACLPLDDLLLVDAASCCIYDNATPNQLSIEQLGDLSDWCAETMGVTELFLTSNFEPMGEEDFLPAQVEECESHVATFKYASLDFGPSAILLEIDPTHSSITVDDGESTTVTALRGTLVVASQPARVITGAMWADDPSGSSAYSSWSFGVNAPVILNASSGAFTMGPSNNGLFFGTGLIGTDEYVARIGIDSIVSGTLNTSTGVWTAGYSESGVGYQITMSLGGNVVPWD